MPLPKPGSYAELIAQANANSSLIKDQTTEHKQPKLPKLPKAVRKLLDAADGLTKRQLELLLELLQGKRYSVSVRGQLYACCRTAVGWSLCALTAEAVEHTVNIDGSACSCPDNRFRGRTCKHMEAVQCFSRGG